eukprot:gene19387-biopygen4012
MECARVPGVAHRCCANTDVRSFCPARRGQGGLGGRAMESRPLSPSRDHQMDFERRTRWARRPQQLRRGFGQGGGRCEAAAVGLRLYPYPTLAHPGGVWQGLAGVGRGLAGSAKIVRPLLELTQLCVRCE